MTEKDASFYFPAPVHQKYCTQCGSPLTQMCPPMDNRVRDCCTHCGAVHYRNPLIVVGTVPVYEDKILLCKRAIEPRYGKWTLPAGFMEMGESTVQGAQRETSEEAGAVIEMGSLFTVMDVPGVSQVHIYYLAKVLSPEFNPGEESLEVRLFALDDIPWSEISFTTVESTLHYYLDCKKKGVFETSRFTLD
ncbi:NUDIX hydrolase [Pelistega europaea]|uniref:NUDIX hydrolase n=1 Tax=Pelistega europaea TaxID=106147 RepID=A0A7Y4P5V4_9BURK|nr:NUDIX hydrolase [Pelistega europaea]NOL50173.1 NUDIX hydrolase [Pelistega europaea]